ncbi:hypothetical protein IFM89_004115 [Coptis chinensis]|uniref:RNase H type-1 domain-containing protein n=1 Tax=Coptis chinensis TaxID=261450 RepID=A0A835H4B6_9MAGN|nr:hypothetical protein IFM89_004115 [Coptis chinensis]
MKGRNKRRFKKRVCDERTLLNGLKEEIRRILQNKVIREPPDPGEMKLNTDSSLQSDSAEPGGVIRDHNGFAIPCYSAEGGVRTVINQELIAIVNGLKICRQDGIKKVKVATDSKQVAQIINKKEGRKVENEVFEIWELMQQVGQVQAVHAYREANRTADYLVTLRGSPGCIVLTNPHVDILDRILAEDRNCRKYVRR